MQASWRITELGGGVSNTVLLAESDTHRLVLKQALAKLRVEQEWLADRERIFRESAALRLLVPHLGGAVPEVLFEDRANYLFAMSAAPPEARTWKSLLLAGEVSAPLAAAIGRLLARLVATSWQKPDWRQAFADQRVFDQLRIDPYYRSTAARHPDLRLCFERLMQESGARRYSLVHGDWSPKNFLVSHQSVLVIDFEVIHFGDPAFDSAFLLNHLLLKTFYRPAIRRALAEAAGCFWEAYRSGLPADTGWIEPATLQHLGCLLLARVDGKSPVEYLTDAGLREQVRRYARELILHPAASVAEVFGA